jgi:hypothetical protein
MTLIDWSKSEIEQAWHEHWQETDPDHAVRGRSGGLRTALIEARLMELRREQCNLPIENEAGRRRYYEIVGEIRVWEQALKPGWGFELGQIMADSTAAKLVRGGRP